MHMSKCLGYLLRNMRGAFATTSILATMFNDLHFSVGQAPRPLIRFSEPGGFRLVLEAIGLFSRELEAAGQESSPVSAPIEASTLQCRMSRPGLHQSLGQLHITFLLLFVRVYPVHVFVYASSHVLYRTI